LTEVGDHCSGSATEEESSTTMPMSAMDGIYPPALTCRCAIVILGLEG
jgi:hypothetical protein